MVSLSSARFPAGSSAHPALRQPQVPALPCSSATSRAAGRKQWLPGLQEVVNSLVSEIQTVWTAGVSKTKHLSSFPSVKGFMKFACQSISE